MSGPAGWRRLDGRVVLVPVLLALLPLVPTAAVMLVAGTKPAGVAAMAGIWAACAALLAVTTGLDWWFGSYRIGEERVELRKGVLSRSHRSLPRDRIRSVDLTADPMHRVLGLSVVKIGTGAQGDGELKLDALARSDAERIRAALLLRESTADGAADDAPDGPRDGELARLRPVWLLYSGATMSLILAVWGAIASAFGSFSELLAKSGVYRLVGEEIRAVPLWLAIGAPVVAVVLVGVLGSLLLSVELWWGFRLTRESTGTLRVRRGLLTQRSISLEESRLRGVELAEPLLLRWVGGARTNAIATGLSDAEGGKQPDAKTLLPPAPRAEARRVAAEVLREENFPADGFTAHPRAALRRRITWGLLVALPFAAAAVVAAVLGWIPLAPAAAVVPSVALLAIAFGVDAYRNLGHRLHGAYLVGRRGTGLRRTVALRRDGIIGWRFEQSVFQRRSGLLDVVATTAAGSGRCTIPDVRAGNGLLLAEAAVPGLLTPFLEPAPPINTREE
ncbi:PH domain-containing protein [Saccharopolyspora gregorii]|uniref:PH domain-containing protein n=1 Tax=Saccharopolyspora gregorii TaxID=33914 RepID=UPI0021AC9236|nr:PH domain-containing protein [Saccharopolyspora gregorii]